MMEAQFKRTLCKFWLEGTCTKGDLCTWSHAEEDGSHDGPPPQAPAQEKKTICKFWLEGMCKSGETCTWAHGEHELGMPLSGISPMVSRGEPFPHKNSGGKGVFSRIPQTFGPIGTPMLSQKGGFTKGSASSFPPKRTLCKFWLEGKCQAGDLCTWAHGEEDIGQSPVESIPSHASPVAADPLQVTPVKRTICKFWMEGRCQAGDACTWAHGTEDIGNPAVAEEASLEDQELEEYLGEGLSQEEIAQLMADHPEAVKTKRTICKFWLEGKCEAGDMCTWAHGEDDLGTVVLLEDALLAEDTAVTGPTQTKRTLCKFWLEGRCQAGDRCTWAHGEEDVGVVVPAEAVVHQAPPPSKGSGKLGPFTAAAYGGKLGPFSAAAAACGGKLGAFSAACKGGKASPIGAPATFAPVALRAPDWMGPNAKRTICKFWQIGACKEGANCTYLHPDEDLSSGGGGSSSSGKGATSGLKGGFLFPSTKPIASPRIDFSSRGAPQEIPVEKRGIKRSMCKFWLENACTKGDECTFAHGDEELGAPIPGDWPDGEPPLGGSLPVSFTPCRFYALGTCNKGASCAFAHVEASDSAFPQVKRPRLLA